MNFFQINSFIKHFFTSTKKGHGVHSPFVYQLCEQVFYNNDEFYCFNEIEQIRHQLLTNNTKINVKDYGAGSKKFSDNVRAISDIAKYGISTKKQNQILFKLINYLNCKTIIELGTSLGINTLYLASTNTNNKIFSIEADKNLCQIALNNLKQLNLTNTTLINDTFENALPNLLSQLNQIDLIYVDGNHTFEATINYFNLILPKVNYNTVIIFDDIYWSAAMQNAWQQIIQNKNIKCSIDAFYFGFVFFNKDFIEPIHLKIKI